MSLYLELGDDIEVSDQARDTAQKLHLQLDDNDGETCISAFTQYFMIQQNKMSMGLLDHLLPSKVRRAWQELIALLERSNRKLVLVKKKCISLQLYCPTSESVRDLEELCSCDQLVKAFTVYSEAVGEYAIKCLFRTSYVYEMRSPIQFK